jgi:ferritin-like metal-binding protein YciE
MPKQHENDPKMTSSPEFHQITLMVGGLKQAVETMTDMWKEQEVNASAGRRALHEKFEMFRQETTNQITTLSIRLDRIVDTMKDIEPAVKSFRDEKLREEGAKRLGGKLIAALMAAAGGIGWGLHELIGWLYHLK